MKKRIIKLVATFFFAGYLPFMPGTWASAVAAGLYLIIRHNIYLLIAVFSLLAAAGYYTAGRAEALFGNRDDKRIVIDEVIGMFLLYLLIPDSAPVLITGFILYRLFDIVKIYPASRLQKLPGSWGIIADDISAAVYSAILMGTFLLAIRLCGI